MHNAHVCVVDRTPYVLRSTSTLAASHYAANSRSVFQRASDRH